MSVAAATKKHGSKRRYARGEGGTAGDARRGVGRRRAGSRVVKSEHDIVEVVLTRRGRDELEDLTVLERLALLDLRGRKGASRRARRSAARDEPESGRGATRHDLARAEDEDRVLAHGRLALDGLRLMRDLRGGRAVRSTAAATARARARSERAVASRRRAPAAAPAASP